MENPILDQAMMEIVDNQLRDRNPPETKETYDRLIALGYPDEEARQMIGAVVAKEMKIIMEKQEVFNLQRFAEALDRLPGTTG